jgi:hypothetical protein
MSPACAQIWSRYCAGLGVRTIGPLCMCGGVPRSHLPGSSAALPSRDQREAGDSLASRSSLHVPPLSRAAPARGGARSHLAARPSPLPPPPPSGCAPPASVRCSAVPTKPRSDFLCSPLPAKPARRPRPSACPGRLREERDTHMALPQRSEAGAVGGRSPWAQVAGEAQTQGQEASVAG